MRWTPTLHTVSFGGPGWRLDASAAVAPEAVRDTTRFPHPSDVLVKGSPEHMFDPILAISWFDPIAKAMSYPLEFFYDLSRNYGIAIILLTFLVRLVMFPLTYKQTVSMLSMQQIQPEIKALQAEHAKDRAKLNEEMMKLYKERGVNPAAGCLPIFAQMPFFFGMYSLVSGLSRVEALPGLLVVVPSPKFLHPASALFQDLVNAGGRMQWFGIDLSQSFAQYDGSLVQRLPYLTLVVIQAATGLLLQFRMERSQPAPTGQAAQMRTIMRVMPVMFAVFSINFPAAVVLYWVFGNVWMMGQQEVLTRVRKRHAAKLGLELPPTGRAAVAATSLMTEAGAEAPPSAMRLAKDAPRATSPAKRVPLRQGGNAKATGTAKPTGTVKPVRPPAKGSARPSGSGRSGSKKGR